MEAPTVLNRLSRMPTDTQAFFNDGPAVLKEHHHQQPLGLGVSFSSRVHNHASYIGSRPRDSGIGVQPGARPDGHASCDGYGMRIAPGPPAGCRQWPSQYALGLMKGTAKLDSGSADQLILARYTHSNCKPYPYTSKKLIAKHPQARLIQYTHPLLVLYISWIFRCGTCVGEVHAGIKVFCSAVILQNPSSDFNDLLFIGHHLQKVINNNNNNNLSTTSQIIRPLFSFPSFVNLPKNLLPLIYPLQIPSFALHKYLHNSVAMCSPALCIYCHQNPAPLQ
ncbi:uncharacterized protein PGTG_06122 [Puccinia graminis f. sp. tritici CRL 75-36-700-3]|uniref:Uncharacterized protein n=1 Tax=Puccinia graminis f. sp. tritici (strain CRL 75-36-700-3 / race SCCL) TaxID=418459 RepID=E3K5P8_PUCGT|nr:uncharacterized protein PGTG_06122 [Puccinia graminis f. sp. tritici CRL 75-36-700-3]EFP79801.1 hypothetical protein PGTG_06122 [Puccinia graminis f. sp. tritici CRL 75-36-700-3]